MPVGLVDVAHVDCRRADQEAPLRLHPFARALRTKNVYSASSADQLPQMLAAFRMFGHLALIPVPDLERTDYFLIFGANPVVSNGSLMTAPDMRGRLRAIREGA